MCMSNLSCLYLVNVLSVSHVSVFLNHGQCSCRRVYSNWWMRKDLNPNFGLFGFLGLFSLSRCLTYNCIEWHPRNLTASVAQHYNIYSVNNTLKELLLSGSFVVFKTGQDTLVHACSSPLSEAIMLKLCIPLYFWLWTYIFNKKKVHITHFNKMTCPSTASVSDLYPDARSPRFFFFLNFGYDERTRRLVTSHADARSVGHISRNEQ